MKLPISCMQCTMDGVKDPTSNIASMEFRDDGCYEMTCPIGHKSTVILQEQKFELLFDIGAHAIADGYYREAVTSFTSSLERFYEFFIKSVLIEKNVHPAVLDESWKSVSGQSERQLGAFIFLYTSEFNEMPAMLKEWEKVQFRNDVIHKGKIPSHKEAIEYGQTILDFVRPTLNEVRRKYPKGLLRTVFEHQKQNRMKLEGNIGVITIPTIINLARTDDGWNKRSLEQAIKEFRYQKI